MKALKKVPSDKKGLGKLPTAVRNKMGYMKKGGKVYKTGGKAPVDPPTTSPESKSEYNIGNMSFKGEEADRLIAFNEHLDKDFSNLDLFQKTEQIEKFINSKGHKSSEAMKAYNVDPAIKNVKAPSIEDSFESAFGDSSFGSSDPFADDPDIQRMREEAAARDNKKGRRRKKFKSGGEVIKNYKKGGKVANPDDKSRPEVGKWYMKQSKEVKSLFDNAYDSAYKRGASGAQARESAIRAVEKKMGKPIEFKGGGKVFKAHNMYKDGKSVMAKTMADHLRLKKKGYGHKKG